MSLVHRGTIDDRTFEFSHCAQADIPPKTFGDREEIMLSEKFNETVKLNCGIFDQFVWDADFMIEWNQKPIRYRSNFARYAAIRFPRCR